MAPNSKSHFTPIFIGVDQTGAVIPGSRGFRTRALDWAVVLPAKKGARLHLPRQKLTRFHLREIRDSLPSASLAAEKIIVLLDCVLGLPRSVMGLPEALQLAKKESGPFGRTSAEQFFDEILRGGKTIPTRLCEELARANSVFRSRPFQKNIQTGTYRLWRDLATDPHFRDWRIWPYSKTQSKFTLFEGYPSLMWRQVGGVNSRAPEKLGRILKHYGVRTTPEQLRAIRANSDLADAAMLALGGWVLWQKNQLFEPFQGFFESDEFRRRACTEGWIAGLQETPKAMGHL